MFASIAVEAAVLLTVVIGRIVFIEAYENVSKPLAAKHTKI